MKEKNTATTRQQAIKDLLLKESISDQKQLVELLKKHYGIETNQTVVSRELHKLGVIKKLVKGVLVYEVPSVDTTTEILKLALVDIEHNEVMIIIKTHPGLAAFVGDCLDQHTDLDILGCLAGENVVFVTPKSIKKISKVTQDIKEKFYFKKSKGQHV